jgi:cytochrome d ubiquinol oxidase subunit I
LVEEFPRYWADLDMIRKIIVGESWLIHILIATFTLGAGIVAPLAEFLGVVRKDFRYDRLARGLTTANVILYATGATMAVAALFFTWGFFPSFFSTLWWQFFWPLIATELAWWGQLYVLLLYYFLWNKMQGRAKPLHILIGLSWIPMALFQQGFLFPMVSYLTTPDSQQPIFNASLAPQLSHRFMGNLSWTGFAIAAVAGIQFRRYARRGNREQMAFWDWTGSLGMIFGVLFMVFFMGLSGYSWVIATKGASPAAFYRMMVGAQAWMFQLLLFFLGLTLVVSAFYMWDRVKLARRYGYGLKWIALAMMFFWLLGSIPYYIGWSAEHQWVPWTIPVGAMRPWKYIALLGLSIFGLVALLAYLQSSRDGLNWGEAGESSQRALITTGILAVSMMVTMGIIRDTTYIPGLIFGDVNSEEQVIPQQIVPQEDVHRPKIGPFR